MKNFLTVLAVISAAPLWADCPAPPDHSAALDALIEEANRAENEMDGREIGTKMWELWADAPDEAAQAVLDRGMSRRASFDFGGALEDFNRLVEYCPDYAEGYNQRAFVNFLRQNYSEAIVDLEKTLELSPDHVAARAGLALTLMELGQIDEARVELAAALERNPWLSERHLMGKGGPLAPPGEEL